MRHLPYTRNFSAVAQLLRMYFIANGVMKLQTSTRWEQTPPIG